MTRFRGRGRILTLINNLFGFETLVFSTSRILSKHNQLEKLENRII